MTFLIRPSGAPADSIQEVLPLNPDAADAWDRDLARRALDELFVLAQQYRSTKDYRALLAFIVRFRSYSPFNAMLVRAQMQGARYVAPASRWLRDYGRTIKPGARPLVILQPMGPVMFVFDVSDTEAGERAVSLPPRITNPFAVRGGRLHGELRQTIENGARDGVEVHCVKIGSQGAGMIQTTHGQRHLIFPIRARPKEELVSIKVQYEVFLRSDHTAEAQYATLVHELAHLYCGHLGTPDARLWPDRRFMDTNTMEFEAESVSYLVCRRLGLDTVSEAYLSGYTNAHEETPPISLETVLKVAGLIEKMGKKRLPPRPERKK
jgi:hypothetical protein